MIPFDDPTLLFTNAGMNQFKDIFLGNKEIKDKRVVNSQKCLRAGGKHNDLDEVGRDGYHHTFFEMLGNWSFGDYYKKEAIQWAWELLTEIWQLPKDKLHATVYNTDDEAMELWQTVTDINHKHITRHGDKENFWEMGETGPCGPSSEIHFDRGEAFCNLTHVEHHYCCVNGDCHRYIELWNLVFIQYQRHADQSLTLLKNKFVDTGMGFERICQVLQQVNSNYDTDIFSPIINDIITNCKKLTCKELQINLQVIADHIRALTFTLADGGMPSNEGRGYVLRRILRRAARFGRDIGFQDPFLHNLVDSVVNNMGIAFPELKERQDFIKMIIKGEEEKFNQTLDKGLALFKELVTKLNCSIISGKDAFTLYDTYGFPLDLIKILAEEQQLTLNEQEFTQEMEKQRQKARDASQFKQQTVDEQWFVINNEPHNIFTGYTLTECSTKITKFCYIGDKTYKLVLQETPFYAESGGQVADNGSLSNENSLIMIRNVQKEGDDLVHYGELAYGSVNEQEYLAVLNKIFRRQVENNHTTTHLLHASLRKVLGDHVQQRGSLVTADVIRFDFTHYKPLSEDEIINVEELINNQIQNCLPVQVAIKSYQEAKNDGAIALFGEKYGDVVRTISIDSFSQELCGGTHVKNTGQIGMFKLLKESSISSGIRRIEAITGVQVQKYIRHNYLLINQINHLLTANTNNVVEKIEKLVSENKLYQTEIIKLKYEQSSKIIEDIVQFKQYIKQVCCIYRLVDASSTDELKMMGDLLKSKLDKGIGILVAKWGGNVSIIVVVTENLTQAISAGRIVADLARLVDGKGGGRNDMAMAGGKSTDKIEMMFLNIPKIIEKYIP